MNCKWVDRKCSGCGFVLPLHLPETTNRECPSLTLGYDDQTRTHSVYEQNAIVGGPGTKATALLKSLGIAPVVGCPCKGFAAQMDRWGVAGCREHFEQIVAHFRQYQAKYGWATKFKAASLAAVTGLAFRLNWLDPLPDLVTEAIRRAEEKEKERAINAP